MGVGGATFIRCLFKLRCSLWRTSRMMIRPDKVKKSQYASHLAFPKRSCHLPLAATVGAEAFSASGTSSMVSCTVAMVLSVRVSVAWRIMRALEVFFWRSDQVLSSGVRRRPAVGVDSRRSVGGLSDSRRASSSGGSSRNL